MAQKIFKRIGLRRDRNLSDLLNSKGALNNLLDTLVDGNNADGTPNTFISDDLNAIRNLFAEGMSNSNYLQFVNSAVEVTVTEGQFTNTRILQPRSTYQNRLDRFESFSGIPRLQGGNGLTAKYFNSNQIDDKESTSIHALPADDIFSGDSGIPDDNLWDTGDFQYTGKIHPSSVNANGGVKWEGFYVPTETAAFAFHVDSTAAFSFDFEDESYTGVGVNTYREYMRVSGVTTSGCTASSAGSTLTLDSADRHRFIGVGMNVTSEIPSLIRPGTTVESVSQTSGNVILENPNGTPITQSISSSTPITFKRTIGKSVGRTINTQVLESGRRYRIRARFYIPPTSDSQRIERQIQFDASPVGGTLSNLMFTKLYDINYDFSDSAKGSFIDFLDNSVGFGGGILGGTNLRSEYVEVKSSKKIDIKYVPKTTYSAINIKTFTNATWQSGKTVITPNGNTTNMEIGNYVFGNGIQNDTRITQIRDNNFIVVDKPVTATTGGSQLVVIEHRGFIKKVPDCQFTSSNNQLITNSNIAGEFVSATNAITADGDVTISRTSGQTGVLTRTNITDGGSTNFTFSNSFSTIPSSAFVAGKHYQIRTNTNMDLRFVMHGAGGGSGGGAGGKIDAVVSLTANQIYTLIVGVKGQQNVNYTGSTESTRLRLGGPGTGVNGAHSGGGFTGLFETNNNPLTASVLHNKAILVAGGGGGRGANATGGGLGGGNVGGDGAGGTSPGQGGITVATVINGVSRPVGGGQGGQTPGGGSQSGGPGSQLLGGHGASAGNGGGGGGGGYYGGGAGRGDSNETPGGQPGGGGSGFIDQTKGASDASKFTKINKDTLVITDTSDVPAYTRITNVVNDDLVTMESPTGGLSNFSGRNAYFYHSRGLINKSLETFCTPTGSNSILCKKLSATADPAAAGSPQTITLEDSSGISVGDTVTGFGVASGTTVSSFSGNVVTLSATLVARISEGATVTIATPAEGDKSLCCPPTDTSPPFQATDDGLATTSTNFDLKFEQGNIVFDNISATVNESTYIFPRVGDGNGVFENNFALYDNVNGEPVESFFFMRCGVDATNPDSGTTFKVLLKNL